MLEFKSVKGQMWRKIRDQLGDRVWWDQSGYAQEVRYAQEQLIVPTDGRVVA